MYPYPPRLDDFSIFSLSFSLLLSPCCNALYTLSVVYKKFIEQISLAWNSLQSQTWILFSGNPAQCAPFLTRLRLPLYALCPLRPGPLLTEEAACPTSRFWLVDAPSWARQWLSRQPSPAMHPLVACTAASELLLGRLTFIQARLSVLPLTVTWFDLRGLVCLLSRIDGETD